MDYPIASIGALQQEGARAAKSGESPYVNPYAAGTDHHEAWGVGYAFGVLVSLSVRQAIDARSANQRGAAA